MDFTQFLQPGALPIDVVMIILVLLSGIFQSKYLSDWNKIGAFKICPAWKTLFVSAVFCSVYSTLYFIANGIAKDMLIRWFFSYVVATSLYELLMKKYLNKIFPDDDKSKP